MLRDGKEMELSDTQVPPGWGKICCECKHVWPDDKKYVKWVPECPCNRIKYTRGGYDRTTNPPTHNAAAPIFELKRYADGTERCKSFEKCTGGPRMKVEPVSNADTANCLQFTNSEAAVIAQALAEHRFWEHCLCDEKTGYKCQFCTKRFRVGRNYDLLAVIERYRDMLLHRLQYDLGTK